MRDGQHILRDNCGRLIGLAGCEKICGKSVLIRDDAIVCQLHRVFRVEAYNGSKLLMMESLDGNMVGSLWKGASQVASGTPGVSCNVD